MKEQSLSEVEKVLLHIGAARERAKRAAVAIEKAGGEVHFVEAL